MENKNQSPVKQSLTEKIKVLTRYTPEIRGGCDCCGTWAEMDDDSLGEWLSRNAVIELVAQEELKQ